MYRDGRRVRVTVGLRIPVSGLAHSMLSTSLDPGNVPHLLIVSVRITATILCAPSRDGSHRVR